MLIRDRPEIVLIPSASVFLIVNLGPWGAGPIYIERFLSAFALQQSSGYFPLTWGASVALFASTFWLFLRRTSLAWWRCFIVAGTIPFAGVGYFEVPNQLCFLLTHPTGGLTVYDVVSIATWFGVGLSSIGWWKSANVYWAILGVFTAVYAYWYALGFPVETPASYIFIDFLKPTAFILAGLPLWERVGLVPRFLGGRRELSKPTAPP